MAETLSKVVAETPDGKWSNSRYNLKIEMSGFVEKSDVEREELEKFIFSGSSPISRKLG